VLLRLLHPPRYLCEVELERFLCRDLPSEKENGSLFEK
jgi:hypothetical protein